MNNLQPRVPEGSSSRGIHQKLFALTESFSSLGLSELIAQHRMLVSRDGRCVAVVKRIDEKNERIEHNIPYLLFPRFCSVHKDAVVKTRILSVEANRLLIWGLPQGKDVCGVYELARGQVRVKLVHACGPIHEICLSPKEKCTLEFGETKPDERRVWTRHGVFAVDEIVSSMPVSDGSFLFLERLNDTLYRYRVGEKGFIDWFPVLTKERVISLAYVQNQYVLAVRTRAGSELRVLDSPNTLSFQLPLQWKGDIEHLWVSPTERSLAWCVKTDRSNSTWRALYLNGELIHEGEFFVRQNDLVWSSSGSMIGVHITSAHVSGQEIHGIVTHDTYMEFEIGTFVREFLIDTDGNIAATIRDNGESCTPQIYTRDFQRVPLAWNLSWTPEGGISFNSVVDGTVRRIVDETELLQH